MGRAEIEAGISPEKRYYFTKDTKNFYKDLVDLMNGKEGEIDSDCEVLADDLLHGVFNHKEIKNLKPKEVAVIHPKKHNLDQRFSLS